MRSVVSRNNLYQQALKEALKKNANEKKVFGLLTSAAARGDPNADYALGTWYLHGKYVRRNLRIALPHLRRAAKEGHPDALYDLAVCYEMGEGARKNIRMAFECYMKAALRGDKQSLIEVGRCFYFGIGVAKNKKIARIWYERGREMGVTE